jgi:predicted PurR-regulated permease PerM
MSRIKRNNAALVQMASLCVILAFLALFIFFGREILFPIIMSLLIAILLRPVVAFLNQKLRFPHVIAVLVAIILGLVVVAGIVLFLGIQISDFTSDLPMIKKNIGNHFHHLQQWIQGKFNVSYSDQTNYLEKSVKKANVMSSSSLNALTSSLLNFILIPIYTFLILIYRALFLKFLLKLTPTGKQMLLREILYEIKTVTRSYIVGLMLELVIVAFLTALGLWIIGVEYFIFLGIMTAILNLIPYIGILVAGIVSIFIALVGSTDLSIVIGVVVVNVAVQFIDNNILIPKVVGSKVSINALSSIVGVIIAGSLAGVGGMFLAIPIMAIVKVIFDRIPSLEPFGYLLGDHVPKTVNWYSLKLPDFNAGENNDDYDNNPKVVPLPDDFVTRPPEDPTTPQA